MTDIRDAAHFRHLVRNGTEEDLETLRNQGAPESTWYEILASDDYRAKVYACMNRTLPEPVIRRIAEDEDWMIRMWAVQRNEVPQDILEELSNDWNFTVRSYVACHSDTPEKVLGKMATEDDHWRIRDFAQRNLNGEKL